MSNPEHILEKGSIKHTKTMHIFDANSPLDGKAITTIIYIVDYNSNFYFIQKTISQYESDVRINHVSPDKFNEKIYYKFITKSDYMNYIDNKKEKYDIETLLDPNNKKYYKKKPING